MKITPLPKFFLVGVFFIFCISVAFAADPPAPEISQPDGNTIANDPDVTDMQRAFVQLQAQIQSVQLAIVRGQPEAEAAIKQSAADVAARFELLEKSLNAQHADELDAMQKSNHFMSVVVAAFVTVTLIVLLLTAYFQWRVVNRLTELASVRPTLLTLANSRALADAADGGSIASSEVVEQANARLIGVVERLQQRVNEFEKVVRPPLPEKVRATAATSAPLS